jgi:hypothetical protein
MAKQRQEFVGVVYDLIEEVVIDRSPVIRGTYAEAMKDALDMIPQINAMAELADDESDGNTTVGRVDESYAFVCIDGLVAYSEAEAA